MSTFRLHSLAACLALATFAAGQDISKSESTEYLKLARTQVGHFRIQYADSGEQIERMENPVFHYTEPVRGPTQGTVWLWGRTGRPVAVLEMIREANRQDWFCFHATSDKPIKLTSQTGHTWTPTSSDLQFQPLPGASPPADSPAGRMRQMKEFVGQFSAHEIWLNARHEMRVLPTALHRYDDRERGLLDGAVFAVVVGTHPEATLFLEAVQPSDASMPQWKFAVGRSGAAEMFVAYDNKEVAHLPHIETLPPPTSSYWRIVTKVDDQGSK